MDANGIVTLYPTEAQIRQIIENSADGHILFDVSGIPGAKGIVLEAHPSWFNQASLKSVTLRSDNLGGVTVNRGTFTSLVARNQPLLFSLTPGSLVFDILTASDGKTINYSDPANPLFISIPAVLAADTGANGYVAVKKTAAGDVVIPFSVYKDGGVYFAAHSAGTFGVIYNGRTFNDTGNHWAGGYIAFVAARGMFNGDGAGTFSPDGSMTRAMFAQVLANIEGVDLSAYKTSRFTDVKAGAWYAPAVEWAAGVGIVNGYGGGLFGPGDDITREQMAVMLMNYVTYKGYELPEEQTAAFEDEAKIASWAYDAVNRVQAAGIIVGKPGNVFDPKGVATRAEVATIFARFVEAYLGDAADGNERDNIG
jgi:hypothetical protein